MTEAVDDGMNDQIRGTLASGMECPLCGEVGQHRHTEMEIRCYRRGIKYGESPSKALPPALPKESPRLVATVRPTVAPVTGHLTTDPDHPDLTHGHDTAPRPQAAVYLVLSEEERAKGFVRPYRDAYKHTGKAHGQSLRDLTPDEHQRYNVYEQERTVIDDPWLKAEDLADGGVRFWRAEDLKPGCGAITTMGRALSETYARDPKFYGGTYCVKCQMHRPVGEFRWYEMDGTIGPIVGS